LRVALCASLRCLKKCPQLVRVDDPQPTDALRLEPDPRYAVSDPPNDGRNRRFLSGHAADEVRGIVC
jgi:hypothetical protein